MTRLFTLLSPCVSPIMPKKKTITLASTHVHDFHDLDAAQQARILDSWKGTPQVTRLGLPARPEREYSDALLSLTLRAGSENGFNTNRSHYRKILHDIITSPTQMSAREAQAIWIAETRPEKFSAQSSPVHPTPAQLDTPLSLDDVRGAFMATLRDLQGYPGFHSGEYQTQTILAPLMSRLIGSYHTLMAWDESGVPHGYFTNIFPYLMRPTDAEDESRIHALLQKQLTASVSEEYRAGAIAYGLFKVQAKAWCDTARVYASSTHEVICRLAERPDKWSQALCSTAHTFNDDARFHEAIALSTTEQLATLAAKASQVGGINDCKRAMKRLLGVHHASLVPPMLSLYEDKKLGKLAETWLISEGANAIHGLAALAETRSKRGKLCIDFLRRYRDLGHADVIASVVDAMDDKVQKVIHQHVLEHYSAQKETLDLTARPEWLTALMIEADLAKKSLPAFLIIETLPPLQTRTGELLSTEGVTWFVRALKVSSLHEPHQSIPHFQTWLDPWSMATFTEALVHSWTRAGAHASYTWALEALGHTGSLYTPLMIETLITGWKREKTHTRRKLEERALFTLETLYRREQFATALAVITRQNLASRYSRTKEDTTARQERRKRVATFTGMPWKYVKDLCVPRLGFNTRGERDFDYGTRHFRLRLGEEFVPEFVDEQGKVSTDLPRVKKSDDPEKAELAREAFRRDKALLEVTLKALNERMEYYGNDSKHAWPVDAWDRIFLSHPLTKNFARMLLWRGSVIHDGKKAQRAVFRITEDFKLVDIEDEDVVLSGKGKIELMSRDGFEQAEREQWASVLADYEIIQPFQQV